MSGQIDLAVGFAAELEPLVQAQRLTVLSRLGPARSASFPQVETMTEAGYAYVEAPGLLAIVGPKGLQTTIATKLNEAIVRVNQNKTIVDYAAASGASIGTYDAAASAAFIREVRERAIATVKEAGIRADP
jgi:tripartite-type tricarboxylate transporter receptor subunit TctC